jgi:hypothetical protein
MFKHLCISAACFLVSPLLAMTVKNVEVPLPPSNYEWKLLVDETTIANLFKLPLPVVEGDEEKCFQVLTHREGDALEVLTVAIFTDEDVDDDKTHTTVQGTQHDVDEKINCYLPNHRLIINGLSEDEGTVAWEWNDSSQDLMHGITRLITGKGGKRAILNYCTTALKCECNKFVWQGVLSQAHFLDLAE